MNNRFSLPAALRDHDTITCKHAIMSFSPESQHCNRHSWVAKSAFCFVSTLFGMCMEISRICSPNCEIHYGAKRREENRHFISLKSTSPFHIQDIRGNSWIFILKFILPRETLWFRLLSHRGDDENVFPATSQRQNYMMRMLSLMHIQSEWWVELLGQEQNVSHWLHSRKTFLSLLENDEWRVSLCNLEKWKI